MEPDVPDMGLTAFHTSWHPAICRFYSLYFSNSIRVNPSLHAAFTFSLGRVIRLYALQIPCSVRSEATLHTIFSRSLWNSIRMQIHSQLHIPLICSPFQMAVRIGISRIFPHLHKWDMDILPRQSESFSEIQPLSVNSYSNVISVSI